MVMRRTHILHENLESVLDEFLPSLPSSSNHVPSTILRRRYDSGAVRLKRRPRLQVQRSMKANVKDGPSMSTHHQGRCRVSAFTWPYCLRWGNVHR